MPYRIYVVFTGALVDDPLDRPRLVPLMSLRTRTSSILLGALFVLLALPLVVRAQTWRALGPSGGDVRSLGHDPANPSRVYLGTADGHIFGSRDAGDHWQLLGRVGPRLDSVVTAILVDPREPQTLYASTWTRDAPAGGGVFRSGDGGHNWRALGLTGQSVRALVQAPSDPNRLVAGTLEGVFASADDGGSWQRISPESNGELQNLDSVAVDPRDPDVLYVGTFHLPWKSADGGKTWNSIHDGMIDDSDVMSILVDRSSAQRVYASACSGIYRSDNGGGSWAKIQGIPFSARRTPVILQAPGEPSTIYAGTTEGLWKSEDGGTSWRQITNAGWVINALELPANHPGRVVLGTEKLGVMVSDDGGDTFHAANDGFNHRQVLAVAFDPFDQQRILAVLAQAPEPILATDDGGQSWAPLGPGLATRNLKGIFASPDGWWASLTEGGLMRYDAQGKTWWRAGQMKGAAGGATADPSPDPKPARGKLKKNSASGTTPTADDATIFNFVVADMAFSDTRWYAATAQGLVLSEDHGAHWESLPLGPLADLPVASVRTSKDGQSLWVVSLRGLVFSTDAGHTWAWHDLPLNAGGALRLELGPTGDAGKILVASANNGLFISRDGGDTWQQAAAGLPSVPVEDFAVSDDLFLASPRAGGLYVSEDTGRTWKRVAGPLGEGIFPAIGAGVAGREVLAASESDGVYGIAFKPGSAVESSTASQ